MTQAWRAYGDFVLLAVLGACVATVVVVAIRYLVTRKVDVKVALLDAALIMNLAALAALTLQPSRSALSRTTDPQAAVQRAFDLVPFDELVTSQTWLEMSAQAIVFAPLGYLLVRRLGTSGPLRVVGVVLVPLAIEILQALLPVGRSFTTQDVIVGTVGIAAGAWLGSRHRASATADVPAAQPGRGDFTAGAGQRTP